MSAVLFSRWAVISTAFVLAAAVVATLFPLLTYTVSLALFGLAHVLAELRYVDSRFSPRLGRSLRVGLVVLLGGVVLVRVLHLNGALTSIVRGYLELGLVALLGAIVLPTMWRRSAWAALLGAAVVVAIGVGGVVAPLPTLLLLAVLHNLTPIGFLAERLSGRVRRAVLLGCVIAFGLIPAMIASGYFSEQLYDAGWTSEYFEYTPIHSAADWTNHVGQYVPPEWHASFFALSLFSAAVYLQCLHYFVVIHVLPRLDSDAEWTTPATIVSWPKRRAFTLALMLIGIAVFGGFVAEFSTARSLYGLIAAVHAWVEIPILLLAMVLPGSVRPAPTPERHLAHG